LFQILEERDFEVCLVNARHVKSREAHGRLRLPVAAVPRFRGIVESFVSSGAGSVRHPVTVAAPGKPGSDGGDSRQPHAESARPDECAVAPRDQRYRGTDWIAIVDAILAGQRDLLELAKLRGERIKASEAVIAKSLVGDYRHEHLFTLKQSLEAYRTYQKMIDTATGRSGYNWTIFNRHHAGCAPQIVRHKVAELSFRGKLLDNAPNHLFRDAFAPN
jgi:hypothetical protein